MKKLVLALVIFCGTLGGSFNNSSAGKEPIDLQKLLLEINSKLDNISSNQERIAVIIENQEKMMQMLRVRKLR